MKAYLLYIALLLAALALPVAAQTDGAQAGGTDNGYGSPGTKAVPPVPAMPYKLSVNTSGRGKVLLEDNTPDGKGVTVAGKDTLVYGANDGVNATSVKISVTPGTGYVIGSMQVVKADNSSVSCSAPSKEGKTEVYVFTMPAAPVTVKVGFCTRLKSLGTITLTQTATAGNVISLLPQSVSFTTESGERGQLKVKSWTYNAKDNGGKAYDPSSGASHVFTFERADEDLPGNIVDASKPLFTGLSAKVTVVNKLEPVIVQPEDAGETLYITPGKGNDLTAKVGDDGEPIPFNGTIGSESGATVKSIVVEGVDGGTLTLDNVTVEGSSDPQEKGLSVDDNSSLTIRLEGRNNLGQLTIGAGSSVVLEMGSGASLQVMKIVNNGSFTDNSATVTRVEGDAALDLEASLAGDNNVSLDEPATLTATTNDKGGITRFYWQQKARNGSYTDLETHEYDADGVQTRAFAGIADTYHPATSTVGTAEYRCLVRREVTTGSGAPVVTLLSTRSLAVTVTPPTVYYDVTLPSLTGATTSPAAGVHQVAEGDGFSFTLTLDRGYDQSVPIVTTSRGETIEARAGDGRYILPAIGEDVVVSITGIVKNIDTANEATTEAVPSVRGGRGGIRLSLPCAATVAIHTFTGALVKRAALSPGDSRYPLAPGYYLVSVGDKSYKVRVE